MAPHEREPVDRAFWLDVAIEIGAPVVMFDTFPFEGGPAGRHFIRIHAGALNWQAFFAEATEAEAEAAENELADLHAYHAARELGIDLDAPGDGLPF